MQVVHRKGHRSGGKCLEVVGKSERSGCSPARNSGNFHPAETSHHEPNEQQRGTRHISR